MATARDLGQVLWGRVTHPNHCLCSIQRGNRDNHQFMHRTMHQVAAWFGCLLAVCLMVMMSPLPAYAQSLPSTEPDTSVYAWRSPSSDGIGKIYMGREISSVMGHRGAAWLERPSRKREEKPWKIIDALDLAPTDTVADLGAGTGYMTFRLASAVPDGNVYAVDIQPEMLDILSMIQQERGVTNVEPRLAELTDPHLPQGIDLVLMVDAYHELAYPREVMTAVVDALNPGGRVVLAEYRGENPFIPIKRLHKMTERQARQELEAVGLEWVKTDEQLPRQHLIFFQK
ncbi:MAG: methyltransferase domain-containing protein [Leptolyngbyaceae bacterium]|nr:methyltransferase domain-containing protein [Leptolyngbyaceae bacterium]